MRSRIQHVLHVPARSKHWGTMRLEGMCVGWRHAMCSSLCLGLIAPDVAYTSMQRVF
jgi:hypothetical protein